MIFPTGTLRERELDFSHVSTENYIKQLSLRKQFFGCQAWNLAMKLSHLKKAFQAKIAAKA